jgi:hypothetical protein
VAGGAKNNQYTDRQVQTSKQREPAKTKRDEKEEKKRNTKIEMENEYQE